MRIVMGIVSLALVASLAGAPFAWAQGAGGSGTGVGGPGTPGAPGTATDSSTPSTGPAGRGASDTGTTQSPAASPAGSGATSASPASGDFMGRHTMTGEVTKIDSSSGKFSLKTGEGTLELHAPPSALSGVKEGDRMSVEIAVKPMK
jgi:hypothetical protein